MPLHVVKHLCQLFPLNTVWVASFPSPAQLSVACSVRGELGNEDAIWVDSRNRHISLLEESGND